MTDYIEKPTQENLILELLKERGEAGAYVYEFMTPRSKGGLGIAQYSARIWGLRKKGYNIVNVKKGLFVLQAEEKRESNYGPENCLAGERQISDQLSFC
jgi:hypothetical protein